MILVPAGGEDLGDTIAINLGDDRCRWAYVPDDPADLNNAILSASAMWTDEISTIDDIPEPGPIETYRSGFHALDEHGFRITTPAFVPVIGPYGSGKSVFLRQLLVNLWRLHGFKFLLTSFEEKVKPRFQRDLRRNLIGKPMEAWTDEDTEADVCLVAPMRGVGSIVQRQQAVVREALLDAILWRMCSDPGVTWKVRQCCTSTRSKIMRRWAGRHSHR